MAPLIALELHGRTYTWDDLPDFYMRVARVLPGYDRLRILSVLAMDGTVTRGALTWTSGRPTDLTRALSALYETHVLPTGWTVEHMYETAPAVVVVRDTVGQTHRWDLAAARTHDPSGRQYRYDTDGALHATPVHYA